jgi:beta-lactam-binding protein with PASTA domain
MMVVGNFLRASVGEEVAVYSRYFKTTPPIETTEASQDIPPGTVLRQNPAPGTCVRLGTPIEVVISK